MGNIKYSNFLFVYLLGSILVIDAYASPICAGYLSTENSLGLIYAPYTKKNIPVPEVLLDPYAVLAFSSDKFREFLLLNEGMPNNIDDYKSLLDAVPLYSVEEGPRVPFDIRTGQYLKPEELSFEELRNYLFNNYDIGKTEFQGASLTENDGPKLNPLLKLIDSNYSKEVSLGYVGTALHDVHETWSTLLRKTPENPRTTLLYLPNRNVVAGGRFTESYFWDSLWIMKGLLISGYDQIALGMLENFIFSIEEYGLPLNANRFYYLTRTQPPVLMEMVKLMISNGLLNFDSNTVKPVNSLTLEARILRASRLYFDNIWKKTERFNEEYGLFRYSDGAGGEQDFDKIVVRPEAGIREPRCKEKHSQRVSAELAWDMCESRFNDRPQDWLPVELSALLFGYTQTLGELYLKVGDPESAKVFQQESVRIKKIMNKVLFDQQTGFFLDFNHQTKIVSSTISAASFFPFYFGLHEINNQSRNSLLRLFRILKPKTNLAVQATNKDGRGQWDNDWAWANLNEVAFQTLVKFDLEKEAEELASDFSFMVIRTSVENGGIFFEKYNAVTGSIALPEATEIYGNEEGFGWTNGTLAVFLKRLIKTGKIAQLEQRLNQYFKKAEVNKN